MVVLAYDSMAAELRAGLPIIRSNTGEVCVKYSRFEDAKASVLYAGTHSRGGSNSLFGLASGAHSGHRHCALGGNFDRNSPFGRRRNLCNRKHLARRTPRALWGWSSRPWRPLKSRRDRSTGDSPFSHGTRILVIATGCRGHSADQAILRGQAGA